MVGLGAGAVSPFGAGIGMGGGDNSLQGLQGCTIGPQPCVTFPL